MGRTPCAWDEAMHVSVMKPSRGLLLIGVVLVAMIAVWIALQAQYISPTGRWFLWLGFLFPVWVPEALLAFSAGGAGLARLASPASASLTGPSVWSDGRLTWRDDRRDSAA